MGVSNAAIPAKPLAVRKSPQQVTWGRASKARWHHNLGALFLVSAPVLLVHTNWIALEHFGGSLTSTATSIIRNGFVPFAKHYFPQPSAAGFIGYAFWISLQALLYRYLPGPLCFGQQTPGGNLLSYTTNGVMAWAVTHLLFLAASVLGIIDPAIIAKTWPGLFVAANTYGFAMGIFALVKAYLAPSHPEDDKFTGETPLKRVGGKHDADRTQVLGSSTFGVVLN
jgi:7-dehydrocholesterol reductase